MPGTQQPETRLPLLLVVRQAETGKVHRQTRIVMAARFSEIILRTRIRNTDLKAGTFCFFTLDRV